MGEGYKARRAPSSLWQDVRGSPCSSKFISTNIYVKRLLCPRTSSGGDNDSNNYDPGSDVTSNIDATSDTCTELATLMKDSADSQHNEKQPLFKIHLNLTPYRKKMPNLAYCILEKIQQDPSLLTKDVERSLTLLQNCCHRKAVQIEINGVLHLKASSWNPVPRVCVQSCFQEAGSTRNARGNRCC